MTLEFGREDKAVCPHCACVFDETLEDFMLFDGTELHEELLEQCEECNEKFTIITINEHYFIIEKELGDLSDEDGEDIIDIDDD